MKTTSKSSSGKVSYEKSSDSSRQFYLHKSCTSFNVAILALVLFDVDDTQYVSIPHDDQSINFIICSELMDPPTFTKFKTFLARWRVDQSMNFIRWALGSTTVRITDEYIYGCIRKMVVAVRANDIYTNLILTSEVSFRVMTGVNGHGNHWKTTRESKTIHSRKKDIGRISRCS
ncbi:LOW QUALITY PROTEIN: hypothetical protein AQUCO_01100015v1 [Aquilegia coerulea]|uniref:Uncharacterized protein n=1 Tax=Aquilegia coerulea TaxID=218851 RepID=A0A2G5E560_AQUCA|nr:LOW QUALITY PROTEIN: hypothetical protein AQUCO_01100015v1 [Aquilegia coerulea]PIA50908.1 LOW QUALITY PROTEIN: hypothetical protein AQUCO_01100015v1 [Aquilegia coerulea]